METHELFVPIRNMYTLCIVRNECKRIECKKIALLHN